MDLIATPGDPAANTYVTLLAAWAFLDERLNTEPWTGPPDDLAAQALLPPRRRAALAMATRLLDEQMEWNGQRSTTTQALAWPRQGMVDAMGVALSSLTIPVVLQRATALYALALLRDTTEAIPSAAVQVKRQRLGEMDIEYFQRSVVQAPSAQRLPLEIRQLLRPFGLSLGGGVNVRLLRV
jgi:hypothetical protein